MSEGTRPASTRRGRTRPKAAASTGVVLPAWSGDGQMPIAVGVSGAGSNLRALAAAIERGEVPARIALVFADRGCPALTWAEETGLDTALVPPARSGDAKARAREDATLADALAGAAVSAVVLAGYMRLVGPPVLAAHAGRILNVHPSLLPAFPGAHAVRDALSAGVAVTRTVVMIPPAVRSP